MQIVTCTELRVICCSD